MRYSKQRELVMQQVETLRDHPTAEEIYQHALKECPGLSLGTCTPLRRAYEPSERLALEVKKAWNLNRSVDLSERVSLRSSGDSGH